MNCAKCGCEISQNDKFCQKCGATIQLSECTTSTPLQKESTNKVKKKSGFSKCCLWVFLIFWICFILLLVSLWCIGYFLGPPETSNTNTEATVLTETVAVKETVVETEKPAVEPTNKPTEKPNTNYLSELLWADTSSCVCAVENDSFDGYTFEKGTYRFYPTLVTTTSNQVPIVWDIYIADELYNSTSQLSDSQHKATVGGWDDLEAELKLCKGQYVYIVYNSTVSTPTGALQIEKQ